MSSVAVPDDLVIGVDIGGTKVAAGLVDPSGKGFGKIPTVCYGTAFAVGLICSGGTMPLPSSTE